MQLYLVKIESSDDNSTAWFVAAAKNEDHLRAMCEDCTSTIVETYSGEAMTQKIATQFDHLALIQDV